MDRFISALLAIDQDMGLWKIGGTIDKLPGCGKISYKKSHPEIPRGGPFVCFQNRGFVAPTFG